MNLQTIMSMPEWSINRKRHNCNENIQDSLRGKKKKKLSRKSKQSNHLAMMHQYSLPLKKKRNGSSRRPACRGLEALTISLLHKCSNIEDIFKPEKVCFGAYSNI
jgi:hypothetical protein